MMEYKGYVGKVEFDDEAAFFHAEVINTRDVITFQGESVSELRRRSTIQSMITWPFVWSEARHPISHFPANS